MLARLGLIIVGAALAACGGDTTAPTVDGVYLLRRVNGAPLPGILAASATDTTRTTGGTLTIAANGTWTAELVLAITRGTVTIPATTGGSGTYTRAGDVIHLREASDGSIVSATVSIGWLTTAVDGVALAFERR